MNTNTRIIRVAVIGLALLASASLFAAQRAAKAITVAKIAVNEIPALTDDRQLTPVVDLDALNIALENMEYIRDINYMTSALAPWDSAWVKYYRDRGLLVQTCIDHLKDAIKVGTHYVKIPMTVANPPASKAASNDAAVKLLKNQR